MARIIIFIFLIPLSFFTSAQEWKLQDMGVGLVVQDENYDKILNITQRGTSWNMDLLLEKGAFSGRYDGTKALAAWIQGPPADSFKNANGLPVWYYKYKITYPNGVTFEAGPHGFYSPGFAVVALSYGNKGPQKYRIDFFIWNRDTQETKQVGTIEFDAIYKN